MKAKVWRKVEVEVSYLEMQLPVRYGEENIPNDFPLRQGDVWAAVIAIDNGQIQGWPAGAGPRELSMKVVDMGVYILLNHCGEEVARIENYVPHGVVPGRYGDYVDLRIAADGTVVNWSKKPVLSDFFPKPED